VASKNNATPHDIGSYSITKLTEKLSTYLVASDLKKIKEAYRFSDEMHLGQLRKSGEPYISHPIAVAEICAEWRLDAQAIMAALLHDVMEDQDVKKEELIERFGPSVASLVDGLSKLDKLEFQSRIELQAENFRKMLLAMARDVRVILIKLADRLHNMTTLEVMLAEKRRRIARETIEVYVPIAHRLGLNNIYRELQDLAFSHLHPDRYKILSKAVKAARGNRREVLNKILDTVHHTLINKANIQAHIYGREKTLYGIYQKMRNKHLSFSQVLDVYGFRVIVETQDQCYIALGILHALFKPMPGKFKDYIAIPKSNGYQSLHTTLVGPFGAPIEFQIRTKEMQRIAESGVAAHWLYKNDEANLNDLQQRTHAWLQSLLDIQKQTGDSAEFLEHIKIDLFPDSVYVFTPKSKIIALPRGATALDFAYTIHTDIGDKTTGARINHEHAPLRTELHNGDIVEIITSDTTSPSPNWLSFVHTGKARSAIRHRLRTATENDAYNLGKELFEQALTAHHLHTELSQEIVERLLNESGLKSLDALYKDIGIGKRSANLVVRHILNLQNSSDSLFQLANEHIKNNEPTPVIITGDDDTTIQLATCCQPIPGDQIIGQLKDDINLIVHVDDCQIAKKRRHKGMDRWTNVMWAENIQRRFDCHIKLSAKNEPGMLAKIASEINESDANIIHVGMDPDKFKNPNMANLHFTIQIENRIHLARLIRNIRRIPGIARLVRDRG
jgi:GTP pyrophosphokinase